MDDSRNCQNRGNSEQIERFASYLEGRELAENTVEAYVSSMRRFFERYSGITKKNGLAWKQDLLNDGLKPKSVNIRLNAFNAYCSMIGAESEKVKTVRVHNATSVSNVISADDYKRLLKGLLDDGNISWYFNIRLLATTGARVSEYIRLRKSDFDRGYAEMWTKGKMRRIYIPNSFKEEACGHYETMESRDYLVKNRYGQQITTRGVSSMLQKLASRYGIDKKVMHPHSFRHLFALSFLERNGNLSLLCDVMGHSSVSTTAIYTRMTREQQQEAVNQAIDW